jgi:hypothetical protein
MIRKSRWFNGLIAALVATGALTSCATSDVPTAPAESLNSAELRLPLLRGLLSCVPQPYASTVQVVGPAGGVLRVGGHSLVIPAGALLAPVTITAEAPSDDVASVRFQPEGLQFLRPATLTLDYSSCPAGRLQILKRVAYTSDGLDILSFLLSRDDLLRMQVSANLEHFSRYAVAW